jgi:ABC-2 type transport system ATP-binding protein
LPASPAIELIGVTKLYSGAVKALDNVSIAVEEGEHCCLLGPNGAGKTTIIRLLQGALTPTEGELRILGENVNGRSILDVKKRVGIVPQNPGMYPDLTVREYLTFVAALYGRGDVVATAGQFALQPYIDRPLSTLSGGFQRRLVLAAAAISEPALLLLDEPTVGLDPLAAAETRGLLAQAMKGRTAFMSTHNLAEAEELCDTVIILRQGTVLVHERIEELRKQTSPRLHLAARQGMVVLSDALTGMSLRTSPDGDGVWVHLDGADQVIPDVLRRLLGAGIDVYECTLVQPTLEDLFVDVVTRS